MILHRRSARWLLVLLAALLALSLQAPGAGAATLEKPKKRLAPISGDLLSAGCGGGFVAQGWTVTLLRDNTLSQSIYGPGQPDDLRTATAPDRIVADLFERAAQLTAADMPNQGGELVCALVVKLGGESLNARFPHTLGTQPPPASPKPAERVFLDLVRLAKKTFGSPQ
jgi:hypothetical protein